MVSGFNLTNDLTVTPPAGMELRTSGSYTSSALAITPTAGTVSNTTVFLRIAAATPATNSFSGNVTVASSGATNKTLTVTGTVSPDTTPFVSASTPSLSAFSATAGSVSTSQSFTATAKNLTNAFMVTAPGGFQVSTNGVDFADSLTLAQTNGLSTNTISVRVAGTNSAGSPAGNVVLASGGATSANVGVSATVTNATLTVSLSPALMPENSTSTGTVSVPTPRIADLTINLSSGMVSAATVPTSVLLAAGQTNVTFTATGVPDPGYAERSSVITASATNCNNGTATLTVLNADPAPIRLIALSGSGTNNTVTQDFSGLGTNAVTGVIPASNGLIVSLGDVTASSLNGWYAAKNSGNGTAATSISTNTNSTTGTLYNFGASGSSDRALGAIAAGPTAMTFGALLTNSSAGTITNVRISVKGEFWRSSTSTSNVLTFGYGAVDGSNVTTSNFLAASNSVGTVTGLNIVGPAPVLTNNALDGTSAANQTNLTAVSVPLVLLAGQAGFIRWQDIDDPGNDAALAIDDFVLTYDVLAPSVLPIITSSLSASGTEGQPFTYTIISSGDAATYTASPLPAGLSLSGAAISGNPSTPGIYNITITATNAGGSDTKTLVLTVNSAGPSQNQTIIFNALSNRIYGDSAFPLSATASSGLPVSFTSSNTNVAVVTNGTVTIRGAGSTTLTASQAGDSTYLPADNVSQTLTVDPKTLTVSGFGASNKVYDGSPAVSLTGTPSLVGVMVGDAVTVSGGVGACSDAGVGTNRPVTVSGLTLTGSAAGNYALQNPSGVTVTITPRPLTVRANAAGKVVGEIDPALTYSVSGLMETNGLSGVLSRAVGTNSGVYAIQQGTLTASANYTLTYVGNNFTITRPYLPPSSYYSNAVGKTGTNLKTALNGIIKTGFRSIPYGSGSSTGISGIVPVMKLLFEDPSNTNNLILIYGGESFPKANFGSSGSAVWNREHTWPQSFGTSNGYANSDLFHMYPVRGDVNSDRNDSVYSYVTNGIFSSNAPTCRTLEPNILWEPPDNEKGQIARGILYLAVRYEGDGEDKGTANLELIDGASDLTKTNWRFGQITDLLAWNRNFPPTEKEKWKNDEIYTKYQFNRNPFIDNPDYAEMVFRGIPSVTASLGQNAAESGPTPGKIVLRRLGPTSNSLIVNFTWSGSATPGTDAQSLPSSATFAVGADTVEVTVTPQADTEIEATEVLTLTLASSANYVSSQNNATLQITDAPVATGKTDQSITFPPIAGTPTYGDAAITLEATASSGLTVAYTSSNTNVATVSGNQLTLRGAGMVTLTASQGGNGAFNPALSVEQNLKVEPKAVTISGVVVQSKVYDRTVTAVVNGTPVLGGVVPGDEVFLGPANAVFTDPTIGTAKSVLTGYTLAGADSGNYRPIQPSGLTANITRAALNVTGATVQAKAYDGATAATLAGGTLVGVLGDAEQMDEVSLAANPTGTFASKEVGTWNVTADFILVGADADNYLLSQPTGLTGTITAGTTLAGWGSSYGLTGADAAGTADPDVDGLPNLAEYALQGNPTNASGSRLPVLTQTNVGGTNWLRFAYRARTNDPALLIQPVFKDSLAETNWSTNGMVQKVSGVAVEDGEHEDQVWQTPVDGANRKFLKLLISR